MEVLRGDEQMIGYPMYPTVTDGQEIFHRALRACMTVDRMVISKIQCRYMNQISA